MAIYALELVGLPLANERPQGQGYESSGKSKRISSLEFEAESLNEADKDFLVRLGCNLD